MKWIVIGLMVLSFPKTFAQTEGGQLLKCLGAEEKRFHAKKETGPLYDLNQRLMAEMIQIPKIEITSDIYKKICKSGESESLKLLNYSILNGASIFVIPKSVTGMQRDMTQEMIDDYIEATKEILLGFISQIQTQAPTPQCLKEEIPALDKFFTEVKYLQEDVDVKDLFKKREGKILKNIQAYPLAFQRCSERLKKKLNSGSTPEPKKP